MRARHFLALFAASLTAAAVGCGGETTGSGGSGGTGGEGGAGGDTTSTTSSTSDTSTTGSTTTTTTTTSSTTQQGDGNDNFDQAEEIPLQDGQASEVAVGELDPIETDNDYYKFTGSKGDAILLLSIAKTDPSSPDPFADGYPDLVITLFNEAMTQIAQNDDPIPRNTQDSSLYTVLPADGTYYIRVEEYCQVLGLGVPNCDQAYFDGITERAFGIAAVKLDPAGDGNVAEPATDNDMPYDIAASEYVENDAGDGYYAISINGTFKAAADEDVYNFTVPNAIGVAQGRETAFFEVYPTGVDANGSTVPTGLVWIEDGMGNVVGQVDGTKLDPISGYALEAPITFGDPYTLHVQSGGTPGSNPFYFVLHYRGGSNPVEAEDATNNMLATPELLVTNQSGGGYDGGFIAGNLPAGDVDHYVLEAQPNAGDFVFATCSAQRSGSGLRNFKLTLIDADTGVAIPGATATETDTDTANLGDQGVALGSTTNVILKVEAPMQDPTVKGDYYSCGVVFIPPM